MKGGDEEMSEENDYTIILKEIKNEILNLVYIGKLISVILIVILLLELMEL